MTSETSIRPCFVYIYIVYLMVHEHITVGNNSYENVKPLKYLGALLTNKNPIQEEI